MPKKIIIFASLVCLVLIYVIGTNNDNNKITITKTSLPIKSSLTNKNLAKPSSLKNETSKIIQPTPNTSSERRLQTSLVLPYADMPVNGNASSSIITATPTTIVSHGTREYTYSSLNTSLAPLANSNNFVCPPQLPYAISYTLQGTPKNTTVYGQRYGNMCGFSPPKMYDLLYGATQIPNLNGEASNLTAYIPKDIEEGCHSMANNMTVPIKVNASAVVVTPITVTLKQKLITIGYTESQTPIDCKRVCNTLLNQECLSQISYCNEKIIEAYNVKGIYQARNIAENFCSCKILSPAPTASQHSYIFTQAVAVESVLNYNTLLSTVTCSDQLPQ